MMSSTSLLFFVIGLGLCQCQYDDYDYPGGDPGSGDYGSGSGTTAAPATTKKPSVTTKAPTTSSDKTIVFPKLKSPIAGSSSPRYLGSRSLSTTRCPTPSCNMQLPSWPSGLTTTRTAAWTPRSSSSTC